MEVAIEHLPAHLDAKIVKADCHRRGPLLGNDVDLVGTSIHALILVLAAVWRTSISRVGPKRVVSTNYSSISVCSPWCQRLQLVSSCSTFFSVSSLQTL